MLNPKLAIIRIINPLIETKLINSITIYRNKDNVTTIKRITN